MTEEESYYPMIPTHPYRRKRRPWLGEAEQRDGRTDDRTPPTPENGIGKKEWLTHTLAVAQSSRARWATREPTLARHSPEGN